MILACCLLRQSLHQAGSLLGSKQECGGFCPRLQVKLKRLFKLECVQRGKFHVEKLEAVFAACRYHDHARRKEHHHLEYRSWLRRHGNNRR